MKTSAFVVLLGVSAAAISAFAYARSQQTTAENLAKAQHEVCTGLKWDLEAIVRSPRTHPELHARMAYHHLDGGLQRLCFGKSNVVSASDADRCWIGTGQDSCYLEVAEQLLNAYRAHQTN